MYALTARGMRYMDDFTINAGLQSSVLMENAAKGIADEISTRFPDKNSKILVLCGSGNNGGDAIATTRWLLHLGYKRVKVFFAGNMQNASQEFSRQISILVKAYKDFEIIGLHGGNDNTVLHAQYDVIVDGLFGIGLNRALEDDKIRLVEYINSKKAYKISIDIPSGVHATTGLMMAAAIKADLTVTFGNYKTGMFFGAGREYCGEVKVIDIGLLEAGYNNITDKLQVCDRAFLNSSKEAALIPRSEAAHKGTFGTVGIIVSSNGMLGASMLASKAAYRAGCGLVKIFCPVKYLGFFNVSVPEAVVIPYKSDDVVGALEEFTKDVDAILIGPGLREDTVGRLMVKQILQGKIPAVFDAGALNLIAKNLKSFKKRKCECVITPHLGEMAKLCGDEIKVIAKNRIGYTKKFSEKFNVSMVVKSDVSLISLLEGKEEQNLYINTVGNSGLATAGSGDVLAGVIASLIAQGNTLNNSLLYGIMLHGEAAEKFAIDGDSRRKMMAGDIIDNLF